MRSEPAAGTARAYVLDILRNADSPMCSGELVIAAVAKGASRGSVYQAVSTLTNDRMIVRVDRGLGSGVLQRYCYALPKPSITGIPDAAKEPAGCGNPTASLGTVCMGAAPAKIQGDRELATLLQAEFSANVVYTLDELCDALPDSSRHAIVSALKDGVLEDLYRTSYDRVLKANVYWLRDFPPARYADADSQERGQQAKSTAVDNGAGPAPSQSGSVTSDNQVALSKAAVAPIESLQLNPLGLRQRLDAIVGDLQEAISDACEAELPHALIKHLVAANGEAQRAVRALI